jgi:putative oxidoreductase
MALGLLVVRVVVGLLFMGHGAQKLFGVFGGHGLEGTGGFFGSLGLRPAKPMAAMAGFAEFAGGALLALGLITPVAGLLLTATMVTAIATVHFAKGIWSTEGGYEYNLVLMAIVFAIVAVDAGSWSLDNALGIAMSGTGWAFGQLALGLVGGLGTVAAGRWARSREERAAQARHGGPHATAA